MLMFMFTNFKFSKNDFVKNFFFCKKKQSLQIQQMHMFIDGMFLVQLLLI